MSRPKGLPKTGGRKKGSLNKTQSAHVAKAAAAGLLPHEFLAAVARGETFDGYTPTFQERIECAGKAAPFYAARLATVSHTGKDGGPIAIADLRQLTDDQLAALEPVLGALAATVAPPGASTH